MLGTLLPLDVLDEWPDIATFLANAEAWGGLVMFDRRGIGRSDPLAAADDASVESAVADVVAVLDHAGADQVAVVAGSTPSHRRSHWPLLTPSECGAWP